MSGRAEAQKRFAPTLYAGATNKHGASAQLQTAELGRHAEAGAEEQAQITLGPGGRIASWNAGATQLFGYQEHEIRNHHFVELLAPEALFSSVPDRLLAMAAQLQPASEQHWCARNDGTRFWAELSLSAIFDRHGALQGFSLIARNRSESKHTLRVRQFLADISSLLSDVESEAVLFNLLANLPVPLLADYCTLHLAGERQELKVVAVSELEGDQEDAIWRDLWSTSGALDYVRHLDRALHTGRPELASIKSGALNPVALQLGGRARTLAPQRPRQLMILPLVVRGSTIGALTMIALRPEQRYGQIELAQASQFVQLGAAAIERMLAARELESP